MDQASSYYTVKQNYKLAQKLKESIPEPNKAVSFEECYSKARVNSITR
jgi:hypothetical protein